LGGAVLIGCLSVVGLAHRSASAAVRDAEGAADNANEQLKDEILPTEGSSTDQRNNAPNDFLKDALGAAVCHPAVITSAAFSVISMLGVRRTLSLARTASSVASAGTIASQVVQSVNGDRRRPSTDR
jgi:hypothetical protein